MNSKFGEELEIDFNSVRGGFIKVIGED